MTVSDDGWIFLPEKLTEDEARHSHTGPGMDFYYRALAINPQGNNHTAGSSGARYKAGPMNSDSRPAYHPFSERNTRAKVTPERTEGCTIESTEHKGEVGKSYYRDRSGKSHIQILCEVHRGSHWRLVKDLPPGTLGEWKRTKPGRRT